VLAERIFRRDAGERHAARSAGSVPGDGVQPRGPRALRELGLDASDHVPARLDDALVGWGDVAGRTAVLLSELDAR
jgi:protein-tyrosine-phosphatase